MIHDNGYVYPLRKIQMEKRTEAIVWLKQKASYIRKETIRIHGLSSETRLASSLSDVEIFVCLYYGGILNVDPKDLTWEQRDRFIVSKGHGGISLYPIFADLGFFDKDEIEAISQPGSKFGSIPDCSIPGFETINGSLGHGLGVATGIALGLKAKNNNANVFVLTGDGELYEGAVWEAIMFAGHHKLNNLRVVIDSNKISMLNYCKNTIDLEPLDQKFELFGWDAQRVDGHDIEQLLPCLKALKSNNTGKPKVLIADTIKGKGVKRLEGDPLCHVKSLSKDEVGKILEELK